MSSTPKTPAMTPGEWRASVSLAALFAVRMLGLFMIYPVFSAYAEHLQGATATRIGVALGIYGLTQALLQIPLGMLSDRIGRRPVIAGGLLMFALGSVIAAMATSIQGVIIGRLLQGAGAIGSATLALTADLTTEQNRTKAMAIIGITIGMSFAISLALGPVVHDWLGMAGMFWLTAGLGIVGIAILALGVPRPIEPALTQGSLVSGSVLRLVLKDGQLMRLNVSVFALHLIMTATFVALPLTLRDFPELDQRQWLIYLPALIVAMLAMVPLLILAERRQCVREVFLGSIVAIGVSNVLFLEGKAAGHLMLVILALVIFFTAFNLLEASLPSLVSKTAPADHKGTAMGLYSTSQFFGIFCGGLAGGWVLQHFHVGGIFVFTVAVALLWFVHAWGIHLKQQLTSGTAMQ